MRIMDAAPRKMARLKRSRSEIMFAVARQVGLTVYLLPPERGFTAVS